MVRLSASVTGTVRMYWVRGCGAPVELPLAFDRFELMGRTPPLTDALEETINAGQPIPFDTAGAGLRRRELPLGRDAVRFPGSF